MFARAPNGRSWAFLTFSASAGTSCLSSGRRSPIIGLPPILRTDFEKALTARGVQKDDEIFFICRSGGRSRMAAEAMAAAGYRHCLNVAEGFEGPMDADRHRGQIAGWKFEGLDWVQG